MLSLITFGSETCLLFTPFSFVGTADLSCTGLAAVVAVVVTVTVVAVV